MLESARSTMAWKLGAGSGAIILLLLCGGWAHQAAERRDAALRSQYRRPDAIPFPDENPYSSAKAELGRALFFDPVLSGARARSCASCHHPNLAWGDGRARAAKHDNGDMALRSPTLLNLAWADGALGWDGKFADLERVTFAPITSPANMNLPEAEAIDRLSADPRYARAFAEAFPQTAPDKPVVTRERIEQVLATFERLIVSARTTFDRWVIGDETAIDASAKRGFALFNGKANCAACHSGWAFTDGSFHDIGTAWGGDTGRGNLFPGSVALRYAYKTPTLRNVANRAPYMHDGSVTSLAAVIELYDRGGIDRPSRSRDIRPLGLTNVEKADLLAFLRTLSEPTEPQRALAPFAAAPPRP